jgi:hypothetical protein
VSDIVEREEYMGNKILRKSYTESYKQKQRKISPKEERLVFEGAIPQIVDPETWHTAQRLRKTVRRPSKNNEPPYRLTGLLFCGDCGAKMTHDRTIDKRSYKYRPKNDYLCSNYRQRTRECSIHFIRVPVVEELILHAVRQVSHYVRNNEAEFIEKVREASAVRQESAIKESKGLLAKHKRRRDDLDGLIKKLYEAYATNKIPEKHFEKLLGDYDAEQTALDAKINELQSEITAWSADIEKTDKFIEIVNRYTDFEELSNEMVNSFIEKIIVHEADYTNGKREQQVDIHLNFIGKFDTPFQDLPPTAKEIAQAEDTERVRLEKLEIQREKTRQKNIRIREQERAREDYPELLAKRNARRREQLMEKRNAEIAQAIAEGRTPPKPYRPFKKHRTTQPEPA